MSASKSVYSLVGFFSLASVLIFSVVYVQQAVSDDADLAKKPANPLSALIRLPIKLDWDTDIGDAEADRFIYSVQPVIPFELNDTWNVISRTIVRVYVDMESPVKGGRDHSGMGDILQSFFISPNAPTSSGWIWGAGPAFLLPTGGDGLGTDKFSIGPTIVVLKQTDGWTYGALTRQLWSVSGDDDAEDVSSFFLHPSVSYTTKQQTTYTVNTESSYNWETGDWTTPINLMVSQLVSVGKQPVQFQLGYRNYVDSPNGVLDWGLRFAVILLFPK